MAIRTSRPSAYLRDLVHFVHHRYRRLNVQLINDGTTFRPLGHCPSRLFDKGRRLTSVLVSELKLIRPLYDAEEFFFDN